MTTDFKDSTFETEENGIQDSNYREGDKVKLYEESYSLNYPNVVLEIEELKQHQAILINNVLEKANLLEQNDKYYVYLKLTSMSDMVNVGVLSKDRLHVIIGDSFKSFEKTIMISRDEVYRGDLVYAFIPPVIV